MRKAVLTDARLLHMGEMTMPTERNLPHTERGEKMRSLLLSIMIHNEAQECTDTRYSTFYHYNCMIVGQSI